MKKKSLISNTIKKKYLKIIFVYSKVVLMNSMNNIKSMHGEHEENSMHE